MDNEQTYTKAELDAAVLAERERCARLCEAQAQVYSGKADQASELGREARWERFRGYHEVAEWLAGAIRADADAQQTA